MTVSLSKLSSPHCCQNLSSSSPARDVGHRLSDFGSCTRLLLQTVGFRNRPAPEAMPLTSALLYLWFPVISQLASQQVLSPPRERNVPGTTPYAPFLCFLRSSSYPSHTGVAAQLRRHLLPRQHCCPKLTRCPLQCLAPGCTQSRSARTSGWRLMGCVAILVGSRSFFGYRVQGENEKKPRTGTHQSVLSIC